MFDDLSPPYGLIVADPPWTYSTFSDKGKKRSAERHYNTMTLAEITAMPVADLAARDCHLMLWITGPCLVLGMHLPIMESWGFAPSAMAFVWIKCKQRYARQGILMEPLTEAMFGKGMGHTTRHNAEFVILGRRGSPRRMRKDIHEIIVAPRREHSRKPDEIYARCKAYAEGPYLELFARQQRPDWDCWGAEVSKFGAVA